MKKNIGLLLALMVVGIVADEAVLTMPVLKPEQIKTLQFSAGSEDPAVVEGYYVTNVLTALFKEHDRLIEELERARLNELSGKNALVEEVKQGIHLLSVIELQTLAEHLRGKENE